MNTQENIFHAIISNDTQSIVCYLNCDKFIVNKVDLMGRTPLMEAVIQRHIDICRILLDAGANVNAREARNWTALHFAAQEYDCEIAAILILNGAEIDAEDSNGNTPLFRSLFGSRGHGEVIRLLLKNGANKDHKNKKGISPWGLAQQVTNYNLKQFFTQ